MITATYDLMSCLITTDLRNDCFTANVMLLIKQIFNQILFKRLTQDNKAVDLYQDLNINP